MYYLEISSYRWQDLNLPGPYIKTEDTGNLPYELIVAANTVWHEQIEDNGDVTVKFLKTRTSHISTTLTVQDLHHFFLAKSKAHNVRL